MGQENTEKEKRVEPQKEIKACVLKPLAACEEQR